MKKSRFPIKVYSAYSYRVAVYGGTSDTGAQGPGISFNCAPVTSTRPNLETAAVRCQP